MLGDKDGPRIKLIGFLEPADGWKNEGATPYLKLIVKNEGEYFIKNGALANQMKELVWEEVSLGGRLEIGGDQRLIRVESFEGLLDQFDHFWDDDE